VVFLHSDHLDTPRSASDIAGKTVWRWEGDAFGETLPNEDPDGDKKATIVNLRFAGQYYDAETGLHYNWNRYYDPGIGRYVTSDRIGIEGGLNTYVYVRNQPLAYTDPTGEIAPAAAVLIALGVANLLELGDQFGGPNGNAWGQFEIQDNKCTLGPLGPIADLCIPERCQRHDACYDTYKCNYTSWITSILGGTKSCNVCNGGFFSPLAE